MSVAEVDVSTNEPELFLEHIHVANWAGTFLPDNNGRPSQYGTFARVIYFDRKTDATRKYALYHLRRPAAPDFLLTTAPEIAPVWDSHLIELALFKIGIRAGDNELATSNAQLFQDFAGQQAQSLIKDSTAPTVAHRPTADRPASARLT